MSRWSITCGTCNQTFQVPSDKNPPDELPKDRVILGMAVPQHARPGEPDEMCEGSGTLADPERAD